MLSQTYDTLLLRALLEPEFGDQLIRDPRAATLAAGYPSLVADSLVGLQAPTLRAFAMLLYERIGGTLASGAPTPGLPRVAARHHRAHDSAEAKRH